MNTKQLFTYWPVVSVEGCLIQEMKSSLVSSLISSISLMERKREFDEHRLTVHLMTCGICGEMSNTRDEDKTCRNKSCFYSYFNHIYLKSCRVR